jgi:outer membrane protease
LKFMKKLKYSWHVMRSNYYSVIANDCLDHQLKTQLVAKSNYHRQEADQCVMNTQDLTY